MHLDISMQKYDFGKEEHGNLSTHMHQKIEKQSKTYL